MRGFFIGSSRYVVRLQADSSGKEAERVPLNASRCGRKRQSLSLTIWRQTIMPPNWPSNLWLSGGKTGFLRDRKVAGLNTIAESFSPETLPADPIFIWNSIGLGSRSLGLQLVFGYSHNILTLAPLNRTENSQNLIQTIHQTQRNRNQTFSNRSQQHQLHQMNKYSPADIRPSPLRSNMVRA